MRLLGRSGNRTRRRAADGGKGRASRGTRSAGSAGSVRTPRGTRSAGSARSTRTASGGRPWDRRRISILLSACALAAAMCFAVPMASRWARSEENFPLSQVVVEGNRVLTSDEVVEISGLTLGTNLLSVRIAEVEERVTESPRIVRARAQRLLPDRIVIRLVEREPAALVMREDEGCLEVTEDGLVLPPVERTPNVDVPVIVGAFGPVEPGARTESEELKGLLALLTLAKEITPALWSDISELKIAPGSGLVIYTVADGAEIRIGSGALNVHDLRRLARVLEDLRAKEWEVESIDLRFKDQVVVRPKPGSTGGRV